MMWWWGPGWGWVAGLISGAIWIAIIVGAILLLRRELPDLQHRFDRPPALRLLEERYARGEITREDFLHRREVLLSTHALAYPTAPETKPPPAGTPPSPVPPSSPAAEPPPPSALPPPGSGPDETTGAMSSTYEPPRPDQPPTAGAEPTQPLPSEGAPE
jgi:hypothetical protein